MKALLRRGKARKELGKWDDARVGEDSSRALRILSLELINESDIQMFIDSKGDPTLGAEELKAIADAENSPPNEHTSSGLESNLANLHLQDDSDSDSYLFSIQTAAFQKGRGAFTSRNILRGDLILSERPIFYHPTYKPQTGLLCLIYIEAAVRDLSPAHLDSYFSLHNSHKKCSCFHSRTHLLISKTAPAYFLLIVLIFT